MRRSFICPAAAALIAAIALGCKHSDSGAVVTAPHKQSASSRAGWMDVSSSGFTISLPADMKVKDLSQADVDNMMDKAKQKRPNEVKVLNALKKDAAKGELKLVATLKHASATGFHNAFSVLVVPNSSAKSDDDLLNANKRSLEKISEPGSVVGSKVTLPSGPAVMMQSSRSRPNGANTEATSYLIVHDNQIYVFSFVSRSGDKDEWRATAQSSMESVKFGP